MARDLTRLIAPKTIAVMGGRWADFVYESCRGFGFQGSIFRIHPGRCREGKEGFWPSLETLPVPPDCTFLGVNREATIEAIAELRRIGAGGAICLASGFAELSNQEGNSFQERLTQAAGDFPFLGPNCLGYVNFFDKASVFPDTAISRSVDRGAFIISQSGTVACNVLLAGRNVPLGYVFSIGNQSSVTWFELGLAALQDPRVTVIGMYLESIGDPKALRDLASAARSKNVPIVILKPGRSQAAQSMTFSHTGAMAGSETNLDALLKRLGVGRCESLAEFMETLKLLHVHGPLEGKRIAIAGGSGGDIAIACDLIAKLDLSLPPLTDATAGSLSAVLGDQITVGNPLDFQTQIWHDETKLREMFSRFHAGEADIYGFLIDHSKSLDGTYAQLPPVRAFLEAATGRGVKAFTASTLSEATPEPIAEFTLNAGAAPMQGMFEALRAIEICAKIGSAWRNYRPPHLQVPQAPGKVVDLNEFDAKKRLSDSGITVPRAVEVTATEAPRAAASLGFPVVLKISSSEIQHKTEHKGVSLNVDTMEKAQSEAARLGEITERILVEEMISDGLAEFIIGARVDPQFGPIVLFGAGGVLAELLDDSVVLLAPFCEEEVHRSLASLRIFKLLNGHREKPHGDIDALVSAILSVGAMVDQPASGILEVEINPIIVRPKGYGAVAVDGLVRQKLKEK